MTAKLKISNQLSLPVDLVTESIAIIAIKRAGKSYTARRITEQIFKAEQQIVIVDPKGDWWGVRSSADGKGPGLSIVILGGEHGDIPLEVGAGELVARMVVEQRVEPDPRLRAPNVDVTEKWDELESWVRLMWKAMRNGWTMGVGLAAPQVGWNVRLFIMDTDIEEHKPASRRIFWNPRILELKGEPRLMKEGCLSLPNVWGQVRRYPGVVLEAMSAKGPIIEEFNFLAAQAVQHELDHLAGELCIDKLTKKVEAS